MEWHKIGAERPPMIKHYLVKQFHAGTDGATFFSPIPASETVTWGYWSWRMTNIKEKTDSTITHNIEWGFFDTHNEHATPMKNIIEWADASSELGFKDLYSCNNLSFKFKTDTK